MEGYSIIELFACFKHGLIAQRPKTEAFHNTFKNWMDSDLTNTTVGLNVMHEKNSVIWVLELECPYCKAEKGLKDG